MLVSGADVERLEARVAQLEATLAAVREALPGLLLCMERCDDRELGICGKNATFQDRCNQSERCDEHVYPHRNMYPIRGVAELQRAWTLLEESEQSCRSTKR